MDTTPVSLEDHRTRVDTIRRDFKSKTQKGFNLIRVTSHSETSISVYRVVETGVTIEIEELPLDFVDMWR